MKNFQVVCPKCSYQFEPIDDQNKFIANEIESTLKLKLIDAEKKAQIEISKKYDLELQNMENILKEKDLALETSNKQQLILTKQMREVQERQKQLPKR